MADDTQDKPVDQNKQSEVTETPTSSDPSDSSGNQSPSESSEKAEEPKKTAKPVSVDLEKIIKSIEGLSVLELADLVKALEERFGVSAAPVAPVGLAAASAISSGEPQEEQTNFNVILSSGGANKIAVIKAVRELVPTLGLKEAKDLVEGAPKPVLEGVNKEAANEAKTKLTTAGGTVELQ